MSLLVDGPGFVVWRHPRAWGAAGRCIGRTDLRCDPRKVRRLARCIRRHAMRQGLPRCVVTSPLRRCRAVGCHLRRWGWRHIVDEALLEANFGSWDGLAWSSIPREAVDAWVSDFLHHQPGGGESLFELLHRVAAWQAPLAGVSVVGHAGWMLARRWAQVHGLAAVPRATDWPAPPAHGEGWSFGLSSSTPFALVADVLADGGLSCRPSPSSP